MKKIWWQNTKHYVNILPKILNKKEKVRKPSQKYEGKNQPSKDKQIHNKEDNQETE